MLGVLILTILLGFCLRSQAHVLVLPRPSDDSVLLFDQNVKSLFQLEERRRNIDQNVNQDQKQNQNQLTDKVTGEKKKSELSKNVIYSRMDLNNINEIVDKLKATGGTNMIFFKQPKCKEVDTWNKAVEATTTTINYGAILDVNLSTKTVDANPATSTENVNPTTTTDKVNPSTTSENVNPSTTSENVNRTTTTENVNRTTTTETDNVNPVTTTDNVNLNGSDTAMPGIENQEDAFSLPIILILIALIFKLILLVGFPLLVEFLLTTNSLTSSNKY